MSQSQTVWVVAGAVIGAVIGLIIFEGFGLAGGAIFGGALGYAFHGFSKGSEK